MQVATGHFARLNSSRTWSLPPPSSPLVTTSSRIFMKLSIRHGLYPLQTALSKLPEDVPQVPFPLYVPRGMVGRTPVGPSGLGALGVPLAPVAPPPRPHSSAAGGLGRIEASPRLSARPATAAAASSSATSPPTSDRPDYTALFAALNRRPRSSIALKHGGSPTLARRPVTAQVAGQHNHLPDLAGGRGRAEGDVMVGVADLRQHCAREGGRGAPEFLFSLKRLGPSGLR